MDLVKISLALFFNTSYYVIPYQNVSNSICAEPPHKLEMLQRWYLLTKSCDDK